MTDPAAIGALRWDAWYSTTPGAPALSTAIALGDADQQQYAPIHYQQTASYALVPTASQAVIDAEITAAVRLGVSHWPFLMYGTVQGAPNYAVGMMDGWNLYQSSSIKGQVPWSAMMPPGLMGATGNYSSQVATMVGYMQQPNYYKVLSGRPLLYIYWVPSDLTTYWGGSLANFAAMITALRSAATSAGLANPYIVVLNGAETTVYAGIGADAIGSYNAPPPFLPDQSYAAYDTTVRAYWATMAALGVPMVPVAMSGWTRTGRIRRPMPFEVNFQRPHFGSRYAVGRPTAAEFKAHIAAARAFVAANPTACPANLVLLYAWNENDEGHPVCPSRGNPSGMSLV